MYITYIYNIYLIALEIQYLGLQSEQVRVNCIFRKARLRKKRRIKGLSETNCRSSSTSEIFCTFLMLSAFHYNTIQCLKTSRKYSASSSLIIIDSVGSVNPIHFEICANLVYIKIYRRSEQSAISKVSIGTLSQDQVK